MNLNYVLLDFWSEFSIAIAIIIVVFYFYLVYYSVYACFRNVKKMKASYKTVKFVIAEKTSIVENLAEICNYELSVEDKKLIEDIRESIPKNEIDGNYTIVEKMYNRVFKETQSLELSEEQIEKVNINVSFNEENDLLYRTSIDNYNTVLLGYNYWVNFKITRPFTLMFKFHKKQNLY